MSRRTPLLVMLKGHPGTGKSSLARCLARRTGWALIDKDDSRGPLSAIQQSQDGDSINALAYDIMFQSAATQLKCGNSCIVDCPLARQALWDTALKLAAQHEVIVALIELEPPSDEIWKARIDARCALPNADFDHLHKPCWEEVQMLLQRYQNCYAWSSAATIDHQMTLKPGTSPNQAADDVVSWLQAIT